MSNLNGFIKLHRKLLAWEWYSDVNVRVLFLHCLLRANHKPEKWLGVNLEIGQFATSIGHLAKECGLSEQQTRTALNKLKSTSEITYTSTSRYSIITINNWKSYQTNNTPNNKQITNEQQTNNNRQEYKESKEYKEKKKDIVCNLDFEKCFKIYFENCKNLTPLSYERRSRNILDELNSFLNEIEYDFDYFLALCQQANSLKTIVDRKIDFRSMVRNHIGIMNGKYKTQEQVINETVKKRAEISIIETKKRNDEVQSFKSDPMTESFKNLGKTLRSM